MPAPQWRARLDPGVQPYGFVVKPDDRAQSTCAIVAAVASAAGIAFRIADGTFIDTLLVRTSTAPASLLAWDVELAGSLLWQRALEGEAIDVRSIGGQDAKGAGRLAERRQGGVP